MHWGWFLPAWVLGVAVSFALPLLPPAWLVAALWLVLLVAVWRWRWLLLPLVLLTGMAYGVWRTQLALAAQWPVSAQVKVVPLMIEVADLPQGDARRVRFRAKAQAENGRVYALQLSDYQLREWPVGSRWQVQARVRAPVAEWNPQGFNQEAWALANGVDGQGTLGKVRERIVGDAPGFWLRLREHISGRWRQLDEAGDGVALMRALSLGEQGALPASAWQAFRPLGLNHLVSISGLHVGMVAWLAAVLMKLLLHIWPHTLRRPRSVCLLAGLLVAAGYAGLAGFSVPTRRALLMLAIFAAAWWLRRGASVWFAWWAALSTVLLLEPAAVLGTGTWLSFGLVAALLWVGCWRLEEKGWRVAARAQWAVLVMSLVLLGYGFAALPLLSPLVNLVAIPWFSWVLVPLALAASLLPFYPLQWLAAKAGSLTMSALLWLGARAPEWAVAPPPWPLFLLALLAVGVLLLPRGCGLRPWGGLVLAAFLCYRPAPVPAGQLRAVVWDVGQGLAVSLQTANHALLFDTGTAAATQMNLLPNLHGEGIRQLDALVLSHRDNDHDGGFAEVVRRLNPKQTWAGQPASYPQAQACRPERYWEWDGVWFELLDTGVEKASDNEQSCVLRVVANGQALLLTGDLGLAGETALVARYGQNLTSQVLVLGHHGSASSSGHALLDAVTPQHAVASSGFANAYRHPSALVRARLQARHVQLWRTDWQGAAQILLGGEQIRLQAKQKYAAYWRKKPLFEN